MPWIPELFSAPVLERIQSQAADVRAAEPVPYFAGVTSGETDALVRSFAGEPELHHPFRGRVRGRWGFEEFVRRTNNWLNERNAVIGSVERLITPWRGVEQTMLTIDGDRGRVEVPVAIAADRGEGGRIVELRVYYSAWPLEGRHADRPPLLQRDPDLQLPDVIGDYHRALAAGDARAVVAAFESDAYFREPAGGPFVHRGREELLALYEWFFSNGGGITLEHCTVTDDGRACALEYNLVQWGRAEMRPEAGLAVYARGGTGKLASARIYDDSDPPLAADQ